MNNINKIIDELCAGIAMNNNKSDREVLRDIKEILDNVFYKSNVLYTDLVGEIKKMPNGKTLETQGDILNLICFLVGNRISKDIPGEMVDYIQNGNDIIVVFCNEGITQKYKLYGFKRRGIYSPRIIKGTEIKISKK